MKKFKIGIIGLSGEGKTIYMTSVYYLLQKGRHPTLRLINDNHAAARYFNEKATYLDELDWDMACSLIAGNEDNEVNLKFYLDYEGERVEIELMDYKGGNISITNRLNNGADRDLMNFINVCDAAMLLISADSFNENSEIKLSALTSFSALLRSISTKTKPFSFVISKADTLPTIKRFTELEIDRINEELDFKKSVIFNSFIDLLRHQEIIYKNEGRDKKFWYAVSSKNCIDILKTNSYNYPDRIRESELPDILRPMVDLIEYCLDFPPTTYFKVDAYLQKLEASKRDTFLEEFTVLKTELTSFGENIDASSLNSWEDAFNKAVTKKRDSIRYLRANKPEFKSLSEGDIFNEKLYGFQNGLVALTDFERLKAFYEI